MTETFYHQYATLNNSVQGQRGLILPTVADCQFSVLGLFKSDISQAHSKTVEMFSGLLLTVTSNQNSVYFSKAASTVCHSCKGGVEGNNL